MNMTINRGLNVVVVKGSDPAAKGGETWHSVAVSSCSYRWGGNSCHSGAELPHCNESLCRSVTQFPHLQNEPNISQKGERRRKEENCKA